MAQEKTGKRLMKSIRDCEKNINISKLKRKRTRMAYFIARDMIDYFKDADLPFCTVKQLCEKYKLMSAKKHHNTQIKALTL